MIPTKLNPFGFGLPYKPVQYLESTGTQIIDTGIKYNPQNNGVLHIEQYGYVSSKMSFGYSKRENSVYVNTLYLISNSIVYSRENENFASKSLFIYTDNWNEVELHADKAVINGTDTLLNYPISYSTQGNIAIFGYNNNGTLIKTEQKIRRFWYSENGVKLVDLVPALDSNNVACMYDTVSGTFKYNAGTGDFIYA